MAKRRTQKRRGGMFPFQEPQTPPPTQPTQPPPSTQPTTPKPPSVYNLWGLLGGSKRKSRKSRRKSKN